MHVRARVCVYVCVHLCTCAYSDEAHLRRGVNTMQCMRATAGSKDGADSANEKKAGADACPDPGGRDGPLPSRGRSWGFCGW